MKAFVFPGQGSQVKGMGGTLFDEFQELTDKADKILGYSIKELCLEDPNKELGQTQFTQPALYVVNALSYYKKIKETGEKPDYVAGHSLGEYNALLAAEAVDFETGLRLVQKRGALMKEATGGGMAAVIGSSEEEIKRVLAENNLNNIDIANFNAPSQIVISGMKDEITKAQPFFKEAKITFIPLNTSGAFHSRYMQPSKEIFEGFLKDFTFSKLQIPVISNFTARPYKHSAILESLAEQITGSVKWTETIQYLMGKGVDEFEEIGHGNVLTKLVQKVKMEAEPLIVEDEEEEEEEVQQEEVQQEVAAVSSTPAAPVAAQSITAESLGNEEFKQDYKLKYAYLGGGMVHGIASKEMVVQLGKAGMMGFFGTGALDVQKIEEAIDYIQRELTNGEAYGINLLNGRRESDTVNLFLRKGITCIEAAAYMQVTPNLVKYRVKGLSKNSDGSVAIKNRIMAKISRPEVAAQFLMPAPERIIEKLIESNEISREQAELAKNIPMADDLCVEADSGGHTDMGVASALMPAMIKLRDDMMEKYQYGKKVRIGAAGGIGTPEAAAAAFILGADFILTGSINQCSVEGGISDIVKDMLQDVNVQDTEYAPAGDMFEMGAKVQVLKKGVFFPARANKLYELYRHHNSIDEIDEKTKKQLQERYFKRTFDEIYEDVKKFYPPQEIERAERNPKQKMAFIFRWYFGYATRIALQGVEDQKVDFQVQCGPALGSFNQWVKDSELKNWRNRHVDDIGMKIMTGTAELLIERFQSFMK